MRKPQGHYSDEDWRELWGQHAVDWLLRTSAELMAICKREGWRLQLQKSTKNGPTLKYGRYSCFGVAINPVTAGVKEGAQIRAVLIPFIEVSEAKAFRSSNWRYYGHEFDSAVFEAVSQDARAEQLYDLL